MVAWYPPLVEKGKYTKKAVLVKIVFFWAPLALWGICLGNLQDPV